MEPILIICPLDIEKLEAEIQRLAFDEFQKHRASNFCRYMIHVVLENYIDSVTPNVKLIFDHRGHLLSWSYDKNTKTTTSENVDVVDPQWQQEVELRVAHHMNKMIGLIPPQDIEVLMPIEFPGPSVTLHLE